MTVWADDNDGRVQIEYGYDSKDVWLSFNRATAAVLMTRKEAEQLIKDLLDAIVESEKLEVLAAQAGSLPSS